MAARFFTWLLLIGTLLLALNSIECTASFDSRRGGFLQTQGSFTLSGGANRAGNDEESDMGEALTHTGDAFDDGQNAIQAKHEADRSLLKRKIQDIQQEIANGDFSRAGLLQNLGEELSALPEQQQRRLQEDNENEELAGLTRGGTGALSTLVNSAPTSKPKCVWTQSCCPYHGEYCTGESAPQEQLLPWPDKAQCFDKAGKHHDECQSTLPLTAAFETDGRNETKTYGTKDCYVTVWSKWSQCEKVGAKTTQRRTRQVHKLNKRKCENQRTQETRSCMECIVVAPTAIALASSSTNCSVKYTGAAADRNGCLSWKVAKCAKKKGKEICGTASSDRCLSCAEGDVLVPVSTVAHGKDLDRVIGHCYQYPAWPEGLKGSGDQVEMGFGHSVRIEPTEDYIKRHIKPASLSSRGGVSMSEKEDLLDLGEADQEDLLDLGEVTQQEPGSQTLLGGGAGRSSAAERQARACSSGNLVSANRAGEEELDLGEQDLDEEIEGMESSSTEGNSAGGCTLEVTQADGSVLALEVVPTIAEKEVRTRPFSVVEFRQFSSSQCVESPKDSNCANEFAKKLKEDKEKGEQVVTSVTASEQGDTPKKVESKDKHKDHCMQDKCTTIIMKVVKLTGCIPKDQIGKIRDCTAVKRIQSCYTINQQTTLTERQQNWVKYTAAENEVDCDRSLFHQVMATIA